MNLRSNKMGKILMVIGLLMFCFAIWMFWAASLPAVAAARSERLYPHEVKVNLGKLLKNNYYNFIPRDGSGVVSLRRSEIQNDIERFVMTSEFDEVEVVIYEGGKGKIAFAPKSEIGNTSRLPFRDVEITLPGGEREKVGYRFLAHLKWDCYLSGEQDDGIQLQWVKRGDMFILVDIGDLKDTGGRWYNRERVEVDLDSGQTKWIRPVHIKKFKIEVKERGSGDKTKWVRPDEVADNMSLAEKPRYPLRSYGPGLQKASDDIAIVSQEGIGYYDASHLKPLMAYLIGKGYVSLLPTYQIYSDLNATANVLGALACILWFTVGILAIWIFSRIWRVFYSGEA